MARKQNDYLKDLLLDDGDEIESAPLPSPRSDRMRGTTLLGRESALARVASGEVRQVTQLLLDPVRCRIWPGNARVYSNLTEESCRELIDSIIAEGGQKVPAIVRRIEGDADHDYEVIAGTRRHWSVSWLRSHNYPQTMFLAQAQPLDDESAFRLADLENRARADVSDLERARNYASALKQHYGGVQARMAERLKVSKGWLSKMLAVAGLPDRVVSAFASPNDIQLRPAYPLAQIASSNAKPQLLAEADRLAREQKMLRADGRPPLPSTVVIKRLIDAAHQKNPEQPFVVQSHLGRPGLTIQSANRQGVTLRLHSGAGMSREEALKAVEAALDWLQENGKALQQ